MANPDIVWMAGGDAYGATDGTDLQSGSFGVTAGQGRTSTDALNIASSPAVIGLPANEQTVYVAFAWVPNSSGEQAVIQLRDATTVQLTMMVDFDACSITIRRSTGTVLATSASSVFTEGSMVHVQIGAFIDNTVGWCEVKLNKIQVVRFDGDTQQSANAYVTNAAVHGHGVFDDIIVARDDWPGDLRVYCQRSTGDSVEQFTPSTGTSASANVDEKPPNSDTDYNSSATSGHHDALTFAALPVAGDVKGVRLLLNFRGDLGSVNLEPIVRIGGVNYAAAAVNANTSYVWRAGMFATNPATAADWTKSGVDGSDAGYKIP